MKLNPNKCTFVVSFGEFLGYMVNQGGIEANSDKIWAVLEMMSPKTLKDVQRLVRQLVALSRFISRVTNKNLITLRVTDRNLPFFKILKCSKVFEWIDECKKAFGKLKNYLFKPLLLSKPKLKVELFLYLALSTIVVNVAFIWEEGGV